MSVSRQPPGVRTGGQYAKKTYAEPVGLVLVEDLDELDADDRSRDFDDTVDTVDTPAAIGSPNGTSSGSGADGEASPGGSFTCAGTTEEGNHCLNFVTTEGEACGLCTGLATDRFGNVLGRGGYPRDGRGSAKVTCPEGSLYKSGKQKGQIKLVPYKAASSVAIQVSEKQLNEWRQKQLLRALAKDRDFATRFQADMDAAEDEAAESAVLKAYLKEGHEIADSQLAAQRGTFAHWVTECQDNGESPLSGLAKGEALGIDRGTADRIAADWQKINDDYGFEPVAVEAKIVNDELRAAGTTDRVVALSKPLTFTHNGEEVTLPVGTRLISDLKTGKFYSDGKGNPQFWQKFSGQLATYAGGEMYDPVNGERLGWGQVGGRPSQDWAVIVHGNLEKMADGRDDGFNVYMVDLKVGRDLAEVSNSLRKAETASNKGFAQTVRPAA